MAEMTDATADAARRPPRRDQISGAIRRNRAYGYVLALLVFVARPGDQVGGHLSAPAPVRREIEIAALLQPAWVENTRRLAGPAHAPTARRRAGCWSALTSAIALFVAVWLWREKRRDDAVGAGLVLGGALGNIVDRVRFGYVVDFADLHFGEWRPFLVFNVARRGDYHRRAAVACPGAADARWKSRARGRNA